MLQHDKAFQAARPSRHFTRRSQKLLSYSMISLILGSALAGPTFAQDNSSQDNSSLDNLAEIEAQALNSQSFGAAYFEQYAPATALDMISRIPGFNLSDANFQRGLGQNGANVLINGDRLTGKTNVGDQLSRIAATNVVKIDIVDGASLDIPGLAGQVANITTKSTGLSGTFEWSPEFRPRLKPNYLRGNVNLSGETGNLTYTLGLKNDAFRSGTYGLETLTEADGTLFETRDEVNRNYGENPGATVDLTWKPKTDHIANLNFEINQFTFDGTESSIREAQTTRGEDIFTFFKNSEDEWNMSIGADHELPLSLFTTKGRLKTIGYYRFESSPTVSQFEAFEEGERVSGSRFERQADEAETILRTEYSWAPQDGRDWQFAVEGAFNYLDIDAALSELENDIYVPQTLSGASARVEEKRAETTLTHSRALSSKWDIQASLGLEYSELAQQSADSSDGTSRDFIRPKGFLTATYKPKEGRLWRAKIERQVGQLNFFDFIASVNLNNDEANSANAELKPSQSWRGELAYEVDFGKGNAWNTVLDGSIISDLVDRIPVGDNGDAVGNLESTAYNYALHSDVTLKGEDWDLNGVELNAGFGLHFSHLDDPIENFDRRLNGDSKWHWDVALRHDVPKTDYAYGFQLSQQRNAPRYRLSNINLFVYKGPFVGIFVEHKDILGMRLNLQLNNLLESSDDFERKIFTDRRDVGVLDFTESREREFGVLFRANLSGTF